MSWQTLKAEITDRENRTVMEKNTFKSIQNIFMNIIKKLFRIVFKIVILKCLVKVFWMLFKHITGDRNMNELIGIIKNCLEFYS